MRIYEGLEMLEIHGNMFGNPGVFHPTVIWDDQEIVLIDTGLPGQVDLLREAMDNAGISFEKISKIIITHHDTDHIGGLSTIVKEANSAIQVISSIGEKPYIQGDLRPIKMTAERMEKIEAMFNTIPIEKRSQLKAVYTNTSAKVDTTMEDGQELPICGGIQFISTSGHTPGHICLYLKKYKVLIAGDALNVFEGKLLGPNPQFTYNMEDALNSLKKLSKYDIQTVICYHGGIYTDNVNQRIQELALIS